MRRIFCSSQYSAIASILSQNPSTFVIKSALIFFHSIDRLKLSRDTLRVLSSISIGIGVYPSCMRGIGLVAQVSEENPTSSHFLSRPVLRSDWRRMRFAELPEFTNTQYSRPCHFANLSSNSRQYLPILSCSG